jgi:hypothetical protein
MDTLKILQAINELGCSDVKLCAAAFKIYMELCEIRQFLDVKYEYSKELDLIYLSGRKTRETEPDVYIPAPSMDEIDLDKITQYQNHLGKSIVLAIVDTSSSILYYRMTQGVKDIKM